MTPSIEVANPIVPAKDIDRLLWTDVQLTNAQVKAFRATPFELVAAPGAGLAIIVHRVYIVADASDTAWTESTDNLVVQYEGGTDITGAIEAGTLVANSVNPVTLAALETEVVPVANEAVEIFNTGDGEWGGGDAANTMSIRTYYSVVETVAFT